MADAQELTRDNVVDELAKYHGSEAVSKAQLDHRFDLVDAFGIQPGDKVLELGCGQGDCTVALAVAVGANGHITAVDPAPADYGSPLTVHQAQDLLSSAPLLGPRISWVRQQTPTEYLAQNPDDKWDVAVLAQCIWYFASPAVVRDTLAALRGRVKRVCIAEYALHASSPAAAPHVLAALAQGALAVFDPQNSRNIRTCVGPAGIKALAASAGLTLARETSVTPAEAYQDGRWELGEVKSDEFAQTIEELVKDEGARVYVQSLRSAALSARDALPKDVKTRSMDVWVAVYNA